MKVYKEFVILGLALIGSLLFGCWLLVETRDQSPTVDMVTPIPLDTQNSNERTEKQTSDGESNEIYGERDIQRHTTQSGE